MINHTVLFKWKPGLATEDIDMIAIKLESLKVKRPFIKELKVRPNQSDRSHGYTHCLYSLFANEKDMKKYLSDPDHQFIVQNDILPNTESIIVSDIEI